MTCSFSEPFFCLFAAFPKQSCNPPNLGISVNTEYSQRVQLKRDCGQRFTAIKY